MELNSNQTELPPDDFFSLMDMNEDVGDLFDIQDEAWVSDEIQVSTTTTPAEEQQKFQFENLQVGMDINPLELMVIRDDAACSDIESISSVGDSESPHKLMKIDTSMSSPSLQVEDAVQSSKKEAFNAQKRLEELRKLPVVARQREARKRHRANQALILANKLVQDKNKSEGMVTVASSSSIVSSATGSAIIDNDDIGVGDFNQLSKNEAELIAETTERNLIALGIDPDSKEGKKQRRKIRNRMSAQLHRERKKEYIDTLEAKVKDRDTIINQLQSKIKLLANENEMLRKRMNLSPGDFSDSSSSSTTNSTAETSSASTSDSSDTDDVSVSVNDTDGSSSPLQSSSVPNISTLFSVFIMFGMTFWNAPTPISTVMPTGNTGISNPNFQFTQLSLPSPQERYHSGNNEVSIFHSRRRLSVSSSDSDYSNDEIIKDVDSTKFNSGPLIPLSNGNFHSMEKNGLWSYENYDRIAQLYPLEMSRRATLQTGEPTLGTSTRPSTNNLRKRVPTGNDSTTTTSSSTRDFDSRDDKKIYSTIPSSALSRIVVTSGKALLDPRMTKNPTSTVKKSDQYDVHDDNSKSIVPIIGHTGASAYFSSYFINYISDGNESVDPKTRQLALKETSEFEDKNGDPMLMMLLPASVVQWGTQWSNDIKKDDENSFKNFMRNHNINGSNFGEHENGEDADEIGNYFIEIGCSVFKAQLVKNVTIM